MSPRHQLRGRPADSRIAILASIGTVLAAYALIVALVIRPPYLGWVGFAVVSLVLLALGSLAPVAFERTRVSARRPARASDPRGRLLVIADAECAEPALGEEILLRRDGVVAVHVVVPVRVSRLHFVTDDESKERAQANESVRASVEFLLRKGVPATGSVGTDKPLESMTDALGFFPATHVLLATPPPEATYWLERDLLAKARSFTELPVTQVVVSARTRTSGSGEACIPS